MKRYWRAAGATLWRGAEFHGGGGALSGELWPLPSPWEPLRSLGLDVTLRNRGGPGRGALLQSVPELCGAGVAKLGTPGGRLLCAECGNLRGQARERQNASPYSVSLRRQRPARERGWVTQRQNWNPGAVGSWHPGSGRAPALGELATLGTAAVRESAVASGRRGLPPEGGGARGLSGKKPAARHGTDRPVAGFFGTALLNAYFHGCAGLGPTKLKMQGAEGAVP